MYRRLCDKVLPNLIPVQSRVLVAVSGGPDSVALAHILWRYAKERRDQGIELALTHVNHQARPEADAEEQLVQGLAGAWGLPCFVHRFQAKQYAKAARLSFQEAARQWRYARWQEDMAKGSFTLLATAHHLGDQAETILYRLLRGSGTAGLAGIYPSKGRVIRPLLSVKKEDLLRYCQAEGLPYALDQSNAEPIYARNRIRLELLPELGTNYNPRILEILGRTGVLLRWDEEYMAAAAEAAWVQYSLAAKPGAVALSLDVFSLPPALLSRLIRKAATQVGSDPRGLAFNFVEAIMESGGKPGWMQDLPGILVKIDSKGLWFVHTARSESGEQVEARDWEIVVPFSGWRARLEAGVEVGMFAEKDLPGLQAYSTHSPVEVEAFSLSALQKLKEPLVLRTRRSGDRMWIKGTGHKALKKVFQEMGIASEARKGVWLLASEQEVFWIPGVRRGSLLQPMGNEERAYCAVRRLPPETSAASLYNGI